MSMAKLTAFMLCDSINAIPVPTGGVLQQLVSPQVALRPQFIPGNFSFGIAVGVQGVNLHVTNRIRFTISDPHGEIIQDSGVSEFPPVPEDVQEILPAEYQGFMMNMDIRNLVLRENGEYLFCIYVNDELVGTQKVPIFQRAGQ